MQKLNILKTRWRNFLSYGQKWTEFDFQNGINLVVGQDLATGKANGVGKSGFLETINFGLFGKTNKDVNQAGLINWKNRKNCEVEITFSKGDDVFTIARGLKPNYLKLFHNGSEVPQPANKLDFQQQIEEDILGIDFQTFITLIHCNPNSSISVFKTSRGVKRKFIEQLFGLGMFSELTESCKERLRTINERLNAIQRESEFNKLSITEAENSIKQLSLTLDTLNNSAEELYLVNKELESYYMPDLFDERSHVQGMLDKRRNTRKKLGDQKYRVDRSLGFTIQTLKFLTERIKELTRQEEQLLEIANLKSMIAALPSEEELVNSIEKLKIEIGNIDDELLKLRGKKSDHQLQIGELRGELNAIRSRFSLIDGTNKCPTCNQDIGESILTSETTQIEAKELELKKLEDALIFIEASLEESKQKRVKCREEIEVLSSKKNDLHKFVLRLSEFASAESDEEYKTKLQSKARRYLNVKKKLTSASEKLKEKIEEFDNEVDLFESQLTTIKEKFRRVETLNARKETLEIQVTKERESRFQLQSTIDGNKEKITRLIVEQKKLEKETQTQRSLIDYLEFIRSACKDENVKQFAISNIIPFLNKRVNHYLAEAGQPYYLKVDNWLDAELRGPGVGIDGSYGNLSGGEQKIVDLAMQLAFLDVAKIQAKSFPDILVLDEILDSSIDGFNLSKMIDIIKSKQAEDDTKVFVVSHRTEIAELEPDNVYTVLKENGFSRLKE